MEKIAILFILMGFLGIGHHYYVSGRLWDWEQFLHHEPLIAICFAIGLTLLIGKLRRNDV